MLDASAIVEYLLQTPRSGRVRAMVRGADGGLHVPAQCDVEVAAVLRRLLLRHAIAEDRAKSALGHYLALPLERHGHRLLINRALQLRENFSAYDAVYVALAERLRGGLVTGDNRLAQAVDRYTEIEVTPV